MEEKDREKLRDAIANSVKGNFRRCIISNPRQKAVTQTDEKQSDNTQKMGISKIKIRPVMINSELMYQATEQAGPKVFHTNYAQNEMVIYIYNMVLNSFKQCEIITNDYALNILVSKKGKLTISKKTSGLTKITPKALENSLEHNRTKNYIINEGTEVPFMIELGVMTKEGKIVAKRYDKFRQINRFLELIRDIKDDLPKNREILIIDFGCGKSYLTFAMYYYLHELCGLDIRITGLDLKEDVIEKCNRLSNEYGYDKLIFKRGDIADYQGEAKVDMVVTLHACDTATDYALERAVKWDAKVILSVPCCQHELNRQIHNEILEPVLSYGILKDRLAAIMTDAIRAETLKINGYDAEILEFIDMEHTPKNLLIRAIKKNGKSVGEAGKKDGNGESKSDRKAAMMKLVKALSVDPTIVNLLIK